MTIVSKRPKFLTKNAPCFVQTVFLLTFFFAQAAFAQTRSQVYGSALDKETPTAFVRVDAQFSTMESKAANSNATGTSLRYIVGAYAGERRMLGLFLDNSETHMKFALNQATASTAFRDLHVQFRLGYLYASAIASVSDVATTRPDATPALRINLNGMGAGGGLGVHVPIGNILTVNGETKYIKPLSSYGKDGTTGSIKTRMEAELNGSFSLASNMLELLLGYTYRQYNVASGGVDYKELQSAPYVGVQFGVFF